MLSPWKVIGTSEGEEFSKAKVFKGNYQANLPGMGRLMDIF